MIATPLADTLVLGSMPGVASLHRQQYYAHPRNSFWPIIESLFGIPATSPYEDRLIALCEQRLALWDVMKRCRREGSLDANIQADSIVSNDFSALFAGHSRIERVFFNGATAEREYRRRVLPSLPAEFQGLMLQRLPSTSPANAQLTFAQKLEQWMVVRRA